MKAYLVFASVLLVTVLSTAGIALPYPILAPLFMGEQLNELNQFMGITPELLLGFSLAIYPLGIFLGGSFIGALSDSYGRKKLLVYTLFISVIGYFITAYAIMSQQYLLFIFARFLTGVCEGNLSIARAIALDLGHKIDKTRAMSLIAAASFLGWLVGPLAGGYLAQYGAEVAFQMAGIAVFLCMIFVIIVITETHDVTQSQSFLVLLKSNNSLVLLKQPIILNIFIFQFIFCLGLNAFYEFYPVWLVVERNYESSMIGETTAIMTLSMMLASVLLVTKLKRFFGLLPTIVVTLILSALFMGILPLFSGTMMILFFALTGIMIAIYNGLLPVYMSDINKHVGNGALMGLLTVTFCIANAVIAIFGSLMLVLSVALPLYLGAALIALSSLLVIKFAYQKNVETIKQEC
ncbi:MFS transporter [uncultured Shewanella sp.]|uniref:MFS transporter n=1 Tax=uncultured Shewanella sp. TaxID=173975 RepID=UPI00260BEE4A|nr:MFS transporter [uncultured Shewanella sp.]